MAIWCGLARALQTAEKHYAANRNAACVALCRWYRACKYRAVGAFGRQSFQALSKTVSFDQVGYRICSAAPRAGFAMWSG
jgi:hypothetical protein